MGLTVKRLKNIGFTANKQKMGIRILKAV